MWTSHHITVEAEVPLLGIKDKATLLRRVVRETLNQEGITAPCEVNVLFTDDVGIQEINREQRQIDAPTDVLSFPMWELAPGERPEKAWADPGTGLIALGDIVLNIDRVVLQAHEYGHPLYRELAYLGVHSMLHLLGYDHLDEGAEKARMRSREKTILQILGIPREEEAKA